MRVGIRTVVVTRWLLTTFGVPAASSAHQRAAVPTAGSSHARLESLWRETRAVFTAVATIALALLGTTAPGRNRPKTV